MTRHSEDREQTGRLSSGNALLQLLFTYNFNTPEGCVFTDPGSVGKTGHAISSLQIAFLGGRHKVGAYSENTPLLADVF